MANRSQPRERPEPGPQHTLVLRNRQRLRRVEMRLLRRIVQALLREVWPDGNFDLAIYLVSALEITRLNEKFLQHKGSTDVITFDYTDSGEPTSRPSSAEGKVLSDGIRRAPCPALLHGEVFICMDEAASQARRFHATWQSELVRYAVHGVLHLLGYDDQNIRARRRMKKAEGTLLRQLARQFALHRLSAAQPGARA
jgi:probable rRNA maturation factor